MAQDREGRCQYRVWTKNASSRVPYYIMTDWQTYAQCKRFIVGRWGHWPPWAFISKAQDTATFVRYNGD